MLHAFNPEMDLYVIFKCVVNLKLWNYNRWKNANDALAKKDKVLKGNTNDTRGRGGRGGGSRSRVGTNHGGGAGGSSSFQQVFISLIFFFL